MITSVLHLGELNTTGGLRDYSLRLQIAGFRDRHIIDETVEDSLARVELWGEIKDRLCESALGLASVYRLSRQNTPRSRANSKSPRKGEATQGRHCMTFQNCLPLSWGFGVCPASWRVLARQSINGSQAEGALAQPIFDFAPKLHTC